jgi:phenylalanyl-tRNA synthetase beta chain
MKVPIEWLKEYVKTDASVDEIGSALTKIGHMQDGPAQQAGDDLVLDLEVRQNRPDVLSITGVARELAAVMKKSLILPESTVDFGKTQNKNEILFEHKQYLSQKKYENFLMKVKNTSKTH